MNITDNELGRITHDVCQSMLGLEIALAELNAEDVTEPHMVACVCISGEWKAAIEVAVCDTAANSIANAMFACDHAEPDEIVDAIAEVANMIGGNIKGLAGGDCQLSLPCVGNTVIDRSSHASVAVGLGEGGMQVYLKHI